MADVREMSEEEWNGRSCPYFARYYRQPGFDPHAICIYGCREEPSCITDEPSGGWPMMKSHELEIVDEGDGPYGDCACGWQTPIQPSMHDVARLYAAHTKREE